MSNAGLTAHDVTTTARFEYERNQHKNEVGSGSVKSHEPIVRTATSTSSSLNHEKKAAGQKRMNLSDPNLLVSPSRSIRAYLCCCALGCSTHIQHVLIHDQTNRNIIPCHAHPHSVRERMKDPRIGGADLYVARLGRPTIATKHSRPVATSKVLAQSLAEHTEASTVCSSTISKATTGSLHDELVNPNPRQSTPTKPSATSQPSARATDSKPCYRCVEYMHSAEIAIVFWTDENGC